MKLNRSLLLGIALLFPVSAFAVQNTPSPQMKAANDLFNSQKFEEAAKSYEAIVAAEPNNARAWYQLGRTRFSLKQFESSISAFEKNIALTSNPTAMYNVESAMHYEGEAQSAAGKVRTRLTFFNLDANTVRQLAERSGDDGKTWTTTYDFKYVRKKV